MLSKSNWSGQKIIMTIRYILQEILERNFAEGKSSFLRDVFDIWLKYGLYQQIKSNSINFVEEEQSKIFIQVIYLFKLHQLFRVWCDL